MPQVRFLGRVLPQVRNVTYENIPTMMFEAPEVGLTTSLTVRIIESRIEVECELNRYITRDISYLWMKSHDIASAAINILTFADGIGRTVVLESFVDDHGVHMPIAVERSDLASICTAYKVSGLCTDDALELERVLAIVLREPALYMLLNDLTQCLVLPNVTAINCGRVLDGLRKLTVSEQDLKLAWPKFRDDVVLADKNYLLQISEYAKNPRHGDRSFIPGDAARKVMLRTWNLMNRVLEFRKGGNLPLDPRKFPTLVG